MNIGRQPQKKRIVSQPDLFIRQSKLQFWNQVRQQNTSQLIYRLLKVILILFYTP